MEDMAGYIRISKIDTNGRHIVTDAPDVFVYFAPRITCR